MADGWGSDISTSDTDEETTSKPSGFTETLERAVDNGSLESIEESQFGLQLQKVESEDLLKQAHRIAVRSDVKDYLEMRLHSFGADPEELENNSETGTPDEPIDVPDTGEKPDSGDSVAATDGSGATEKSPFESDEAESESEASTEEPSTATTEEPDTDDTGVEKDPFADLAEGSVSRQEAADSDTLWRVMPWGREETGKTHFSLTMPRPVAYIDTEQKADDLAGKFDGTIRFWEVEDYSEALEAVKAAEEYLGAWLEERGRRGTIVVDSMSDMWEWSQEEYVSRYYPTEDSAGDVSFSSAMEGGADDWKEIKRLHNKQFRRRLIETDFHLCLPSKATEAYSEVIEGEASKPPDKPSGEKENVYKVNHVLHLRKTDDGREGTLEKSGLTKYGFRGLEDPTFPKLREVVEDIREAEESDSNVPLGQVTSESVTIGEGIDTRGGDK